jgi:chromosome segregation ATPase
MSNYNKLHKQIEALNKINYETEEDIKKALAIYDKLDEQMADLDTDFNSAVKDYATNFNNLNI